MTITKNPMVKRYIATGFCIGILSGLLGVGGGIFLVPALVTYFAIDQHKAHAISLAVVLPTAVTGALVYGIHGDMDYSLAAKIAVGGIIGALIGARLMKKVPAAVLKRMFGVLLCLVGVRMLLS